MHAADLMKSASENRVSGLTTLIESPTSDAHITLPILVPEDWELRRISDIIGERLRVFGSKREREQVKGRAQVVQTIPDNQTEWVLRNLFGRSKKHGAPIVHIGFVPDGMMVSLKPRGDFSAEILEVFSRSQDFQFMIERLWHDAISS